MKHTKVHARQVVATHCCALNMFDSDIRGFFFALTTGTQSGLLLPISRGTPAVHAGNGGNKKKAENKGFHRQLMADLDPLTCL